MHDKRLNVWLLVIGAAGVLALIDCAAGPVDFDDDPIDTTTGSMGGGGSTGTGIGGETTSTTSSSPCGIDCSVIDTPDCHVAECNAQNGQCEVKKTSGDTCDDKLFCTTDDTCQDGMCIGETANDCGLVAATCQEVVCDEVAKNCTQKALAPGASCASNDLCQIGATCQNGLCIGTPNDCFFEPVPNECHVSTCNSNNGKCEPLPGNEGKGCNDANDLCTLGKTCSAGVCVGGSPKDCSYLTVGCFDGVCDTMTGQCGQKAIMAGDKCQEAADDCNEGICDMNGKCNASPINEGGNCNSDNCWTTQLCASGTCQGGTQILTCTDNDQCCPAGCLINNDKDCLTEIIISALNNGHTGNLNGIAGADAQCQAQAQAAGKTGTWRAFLSSTAQDVKDILPVPLQGLPIVRLDGQPLFNNWAHIWSLGSANWGNSNDIQSFDGKDVDENTGANPEWQDADAWHGSNADGTNAPSFNCNDWTSDSAAVNGKNGEWDMHYMMYGPEIHPCNYTAAVGCVLVGG